MIRAKVSPLKTPNCLIRQGLYQSIGQLLIIIYHQYSYILFINNHDTLSFLPKAALSACPVAPADGTGACPVGRHIVLGWNLYPVECSCFSYSTGAKAIPLGCG